MIIGHLPAGYLAATGALDRLRVTPRQGRALLATALVASIAPDIDLVYFYTLGGDAHHHAYPTHWPSAWLVVTALGIGVAWSRRSRFGALLAAFAGAGGLLHLVLDSIAGRVRWGAPFSARETTLVVVPDSSAHWMVDMATHWTFGAEVALVALAAVVWWRRR